MGLDSVDLQERIYNISYLPSIIIDEKKVFSGYVPEDEINPYLD
jgi:hypothetical protein